jgi:hypothetical protein
MEFVVVFEQAVFALDLAFGGGEMAQDEIVLFDFFVTGSDGAAAISFVTFGVDVVIE